MYRRHQCLRSSSLVLLPVSGKVSKLADDGKQIPSAMRDPLFSPTPVLQHVIFLPCWVKRDISWVIKARGYAVTHTAFGIEKPK